MALFSDTLQLLTGLQIQQNIARANFNAPRGIRYGEELYDGRMQASRLCRVTKEPETGTTAFTVFPVPAENVQPDTESSNNGSTDSKPNPSGTAEDDEDAKPNLPKTKGPIRMFGILTPQALRLAQGDAVKMVEDIIPQIVTVDGEMKEVEIKIRRARKHRAKAEVAESERRGSRLSILHGGRGEALLSK